MNNEENILSMLENLTNKVDKLEAGQATLITTVDSLEAKTMRIEANQAAILTKLNEIQIVTMSNTYDITLLKHKAG